MASKESRRNGHGPAFTVIYSKVPLRHVSVPGRRTRPRPTGRGSRAGSSPRGFAGERHPREARGQGGVAVDGCVPNVDVDDVEAAPLATALTPRAVLFRALAVCCVRLDRGACPERRNPSVMERAGRPQSGSHSARPSSFELATLFRHGHRSPARPLDASRSPLGSGGTGRSISQVSGAGIDWGAIPASPGRHARPCGGHPRLDRGIRSRT